MEVARHMTRLHGRRADVHDARGAVRRTATRSCNGMASFIPVAAIMLAQRDACPRARLAGRRRRGRSAARPRARFDARGAALARLRHVPRAVRRLLALRAERANLGLFCVGAAQLDMYGNANNSIIGDDYHRPKVRLPGTAGPRRHGLARQAPLLLEPQPQPALARREGRLPARRRVPRRGRRARARSG